MARFPNPYGGQNPYPQGPYPPYQQNPSPPPGYGSGGQYPLGYESAAGAVPVAGFFNAVYGWMAAGLGLTAVVAWWVSTQYAVLARVFSPGAILLLFVAEIALVMVIAGATRRISAPAATGLFLLYSALNGLTLSAVFLLYTQASIFSAFLVSAGTFGAMSVYGMVTRRDLTAWGSYLMMGLIGLVIASLVSVFWHNTVLQVLINYVGVLLFVGLTAYDTQRLRAIAYQTSGDAALSARYSVVGALTLYLDFINLFLFVLRLMGDRRR